MHRPIALRLDPWLLVTFVPAIGLIEMVVIPREEWFLERNFHYWVFELKGHGAPLVCKSVVVVS